MLGFKKVIKLKDGRYVSAVTILHHFKRPDEYKESTLVFWEIGKTVFPNEELKKRFEYANGLHFFPNLTAFENDCLMGKKCKIGRALKREGLDIERGAIITCEYEPENILPSRIHNIFKEAIVLSKCFVTNIEDEED